MKNLKKSAFSLIELSIVLLIIGILIAGVTQSSRLIRQMKLASARSVTESSPVPSIKGLTMWLETTSENAFNLELEDQAAMSSETVWLDRNPQTSQKSSALPGSGFPIYKDKCINDLPCLYFKASATNGLKVKQVMGTMVGVSVFVVFKTSETLPTDSILFTNLADEAAGNGFFRIKLGSTNGVVYSTFDDTGNALDTDVVVATDLSANTTYLIEVIDSGTKILVHNNLKNSISSTDKNTELKNFNLGVNVGYRAGEEKYFDGDIAEIIFFDRGLKEEERNSVQNYLAKKWGIKMKI